MRVYRYIDGQCYSAQAPDDSLAICLGPMSNRDAKITDICWTRRYYKEERIVPFPDKWYNPDVLVWKREEREGR